MLSAKYLAYLGRVLATVSRRSLGNHRRLLQYETPLVFSSQHGGLDGSLEICNHASRFGAPRDVIGRADSPQFATHGCERRGEVAVSLWTYATNSVVQCVAYEHGAIGRNANSMRPTQGDIGFGAASRGFSLDLFATTGDC
jgi:hypothetical protein